MSGFSGPVTATKFQGVPIDSTTPTSQQVLIYSSTTETYVPTDAGGATGDPGPAGPTGPQGPTGPTGASSVNLSKVNFADQSTVPATPTSSSNLVAITTAGRGLFQQQNETGKANFVGGALWDLPYQLIVPSATATPSSITGYLPAVSNAGTFTAPAANIQGVYQNIATAASIGAKAYVTGQNMFYRTQATTTYYGGFFYYGKIYLPDASYATNTYLCAGLSSNFTGTLGAGNGPVATESVAVFQYAPDFPFSNTNWIFTYGGTTGSTLVNTTMAFAAQHVYEFFIWCASGATTIYWQINDLTAATTKTGTVSVSTSLPSSGVAMAGGIGLQTNNTTARNIQLERVHIIADNG